MGQTVDRAITRPTTFFPTSIVELEAQLHDPEVLPHMYSKVDIEKIISTIPAARGPVNAEDFAPCRGGSRCCDDIDK